MAARTGDQGFEPARSQRFCRHVIGAGAVKHHNGFEFRAVGVHNRAHSAKIAFAFFANVADE